MKIEYRLTENWPVLFQCPQLCYDIQVSCQCSSQLHLPVWEMISTFQLTNTSDEQELTFLSQLAVILEFPCKSSDYNRQEKQCLHSAA